jgi:hypothetical protein
MRMVPLQDAVATRSERTTADGVQVTPSYMLLGNWDANVARFDSFTLDGRRYEIVFIQQNRQYECKAEVAYLG